MTTYNSWPLGKLPKEFQRQEPFIIREMGYKWEDPRDIISIFEEKVAKFAGSKYAISCDCCSHGLFLVLKYIRNNKLYDCDDIIIPKNTYISVPMQIKHAEFNPVFEDIKWTGQYKLNPLNVYDAAVRWTKGMYIGGFSVVSFQIKKRVPIGRGGVILTDDFEAYKMLKLMSYDGRDLNTPYNSSEHFKCMGYHYYMTPEDAARGIILMDKVPEVNDDSGGWGNYPDISKVINYSE